MKSIRVITAVLLIAAVGAGCSKRESRRARAAREAAAQAEALKQRETPGPVRVADERVVPATKTVVNTPASFADGEAAFKAKNYKAATAIFEAYVQRKPGNGWGYYMLGLSAWKSGDFPKAEKAFDQAHAFYERYGGITIILARFMPFIRTFAPFVAGVAMMGRPKFTAYNVVGALLWVLGIATAGYFFGNLPFVREHLDKIIWGLILVPGLIAIYGAWHAGRKSSPEVSRSSAN